MSKGFQNITGTFDILPETHASDGNNIPHSAEWNRVETLIREIMGVHGFQEIRTPILEPTELIARGIGGDTDIVSKEMFAFERGETQYVMRPEVTAPVMRAYMQHHLAQRGGVQKLYYIGPCFRAERPQKGRFRQFHQFGVEVIGSGEPLADVETIICMMAIYRAAGISDTRLRLNSLGDTDDRNAYRAALKEYFEPLKSSLTETSRRRLESNPLRILDTKIDEEIALLKDAPKMPDFLSAESEAHFEMVCSLLEKSDIEFEVDPLLVRGLDYYSRTAFELESDALGAQSSLAGGGRYDKLASALGASSEIPAVGFAAGMERLFLALGENAEPELSAPTLDLFVIALGDAATAWLLPFMITWRRAGHRVSWDVSARSMKAQMKEANRKNALYTLIAGDEEVSSGQVILRNMDSGMQKELAPVDVSNEIGSF